jgi:glutamine synthetase
VSAAIKALRAGIATLRARMEHDHEGTAEQAAHIRDEDLPPLNAVRAAADALETLVADDLWPIATYQEMLFIL